MASFSHLFQNPLPTYLVHVDNGIHVVFNGKLDAAMLLPHHSILPRDNTSDSGSDLFSDDEP